LVNQGDINERPATAPTRRGGVTTKEGQAPRGGWGLYNMFKTIEYEFARRVVGRAKGREKLIHKAIKFPGDQKEANSTEGKD